MITKKQVAEIRDFFDNYEWNMNQLWGDVTSSERHNKLSDNMTSSKSAENLKSDQHRHEDGIAKMLYGQHFPKNQSILSSSTPNLSDSSTATNNDNSSSRLLPLLQPLRKYFYLPEDKIHSSELVKKRQHFDKSYDKQDSTGISNKLTNSVGGEGENSKIGQTKNRSSVDSLSLKGKLSSSLSGCDQKILQSSDSIKINESSAALPPRKASRITAPTLIKNNNSIVCGPLDSTKCGGNEKDFTQQQATNDAFTSSTDSGQKHQRSRDLKPIKSSAPAQQQQHNLILMNDDCKLLQVQDEQAEASTSTSTSPGGTCADKCSKNPRAQKQQQCHHDDKNTCKINETSTTNSRINRKHNLNLDLYLDKELSAWLAEQERKRQMATRALDNDDKTAITNTGDATDCGAVGSRDDYAVDVVGNSSEKSTNNCDNSSNSHRFSDSFSSNTSTTCANSEIDMPLIDERCHARLDNGRGRIFTDGEYIYGPYDFDLFCNEFYHFDDDDDVSKRANDDEAEKRANEPGIINSELLKNHDEVDNSSEVSFVRDVDVDAGGGCEILRTDKSDRGNNDRVAIEITVTNCPDDDEPDFTSSTRRNHDVVVDKNFNYAPSDAFKRNLIDLMDEGDNYVSNNRSKHIRMSLSDDLHNVRPTIAATIYAENFDAPFIVAMAELLNNAQQFNYERDKIVEITDENEYLFESPSRAECSGTSDDETFSNERQREFIFGDNQRRSNDDTENKIRFKEHDEALRQPDSPQLHRTRTPLAIAKCDELDNCFSESRIDADDDRG